MIRPLDYCRLERPVGGVLLARSQARQRYQLATERNGRPSFSPFEKDFGLGEIGGFKGAGFGEALEGERKALADAVVGDGENVWAAHAEDEEHFDGPGADAADLGEVLDDFGVGHFFDGGVGGDGSVEDLGGEVAEGFDLVAGDAGGAEGLIGGVEEKLGGGIAAEVLADAAVNGGGSFAVELLIEDGLEQGFKGRGGGSEPKGERAGAADEAGEFEIGGAEVLDGLVGVEGKFAAAAVVNHGRSLSQCARGSVDCAIWRSGRLRGNLCGKGSNNETARVCEDVVCCGSGDGGGGWGGTVGAWAGGGGRRGCEARFGGVQVPL